MMLEAESPVKVTPVRWVQHKHLSDLVAVRDYPNFYVNLINGKLTYKRGKIRIPTGETRIRAAQKVAEERLAQIKHGLSAGAAKRQRMGVRQPRLKDLWDEAMIVKFAESKPATIIDYKKQWKIALEPFWGKLTTADINQARVEEFKVWYLEHFPMRKAERCVIHLGVLFRYCLRHGYIQRLPDMKVLEKMDETIDLNAKREEVGRALSHDEVTLLMRAVEAYRYKRRNGCASGHRDLLYLRGKLAVSIALLGGGARKGEILGIMWERVDFDANHFEVWSSKNGGWREIPMNDITKPLLQAMQKLTGHTPWVFPMATNPSRPISSQILDKVWWQIRAMSGIKGRLRFHDLRHTFATRTAEEGWPPVVACEILDMSLDIYQNTYCKPGRASKHQLMRKVSKNFFGGSDQ
jgi:integrase